MSHVTSLDAIRPLLETSLDATIVINDRGEVIDWNVVAEETFGWPKAEAVGQPLTDLIVPDEQREAHQRGLRRAAESPEPTVSKRFQLDAHRRDGSRLPVELSLMSARLETGERIFIGFARDLSERLRTDHLMKQRARQAELLFKIAAKMAETESIEDGFKACLEVICDISGWEIGHVFLVAEVNGRPSPIPTNVWYHSHGRHSDNYVALKQATARLDYRGTESLPGVIIQTGEPAWFSSIDVVTPFVRLSAARLSGVASAFAFPVKYRGGVVAIMEFFSSERVDLDPDMMNTVSVISEQLGRVFERKRVFELQKTLVEELNHRVKNNLATVQSIAQQTLRAARTPEEFVETFTARIHALAQAHNILNRHAWEAAELTEVVEKTLQPFLSRVDYGGPSVTLAPSYIITLHLIFHELATNASKSGALSASEGHVSVRWCVVEENGQPEIYLVWQESGGPRVEPPKRLGFGSKLIERGARWDLGAHVSLDFQESGLICELRIPTSDKVRPHRLPERDPHELVEFRDTLLDGVGCA